MLNIKTLGNHQTELSFSGGRVLFSYETPVAAWINGQYYATDKKWSVTTSKHINKWTHLPVTKPQEWFDSLVSQFDIER